jgi:hypothetical protein
VTERFKTAVRDAWIWCAGSWRTAWFEPSACLHPAATVLHLPLRPSPRLHRARWWLVSAILAYALQLVLERQFPMAAVVALLAIFGLRPVRAGTWRHLRVDMDGRLFLITESGGCLQASPGSGGLRLGQHVLLVLRTDRGTSCMLLGPDNVAPAVLAALKRRLPD